MRQALRALAAGGLGLAVSFITACGSSSSLLSSSDASNLSGLIQQVSSDASSGNCAAVQGDLNSLTQALNVLPSSLNGGLRANLAQGVGRVRTLALEKCPATTSTPTTTVNTTTTQTKTKTTTVPTTTTTTTTPTQTVTTPTSTATTPANTGTTSTGPSTGGTGLGSQGGSGGGGGGNGGNGSGNGNGG